MRASERARSCRTGALVPNGRNRHSTGPCRGLATRHSRRMCTCGGLPAHHTVRNCTSARVSGVRSHRPATSRPHRAPQTSPTGHSAASRTQHAPETCAPPTQRTRAAAPAADRPLRTPTAPRKPAQLAAQPRRAPSTPRKPARPCRLNRAAGFDTVAERPTQPAGRPGLSPSAAACRPSGGRRSRFPFRAAPRAEASDRFRGAARWSRDAASGVVSARRTLTAAG